MRPLIPKLIYALAVFVLGAGLALVIWQPVLPSGWIIQGMAKQIDPGNLSLDKPVVLRFDLAGKGGGVYNLVLSKEKVEVIEGHTEQVDLVVATKATSFNRLMIQMAQGTADEFVFAKLVISNELKIAGDMTVLELLNPTDKGKQ